MSVKPVRMFNFETSTEPTTQTYASTMVWDSVIPFTERLLTEPSDETQTIETISTTDITSTLPDPDNPIWHQETTYESFSAKVLFTHANSGQRFNGRYGRSVENYEDFRFIRMDAKNSGNPVAFDFYLIIFMIICWLNLMHLQNK